MDNNFIEGYICVDHIPYKTKGDEHDSKTIMSLFNVDDYSISVDVITFENKQHLDSQTGMVTRYKMTPQAYKFLTENEPDYVILLFCNPQRLGAFTKIAHPSLMDQILVLSYSVTDWCWEFLSVVEYREWSRQWWTFFKDI
jgi:hypothetical protein